MMKFARIQSLLPAVLMCLSLRAVLAQYDTCYLCGEDGTVANPDMIVDIPPIVSSSLSQAPCSEIELAALYGLLNPTICSVAQTSPIFLEPCGCKKRLELPDATDAPTATPSSSPSGSPTVSSMPSDMPSMYPSTTSQAPSDMPSLMPSSLPTQDDIELDETDMPDEDIDCQLSTTADLVCNSFLASSFGNLCSCDDDDPPKQDEGLCRGVLKQYTSCPNLPTSFFCSAANFVCPP